MTELQQTLSDAIMAIRERKIPKLKKLWFRIRKKPLLPRPMMAVHPEQEIKVSSFIGERTDVIIVDTLHREEELLVAKAIAQDETTLWVWIPCEASKKHMQHIFQLTHGRMIRWSEATPTNILTNRILVVDDPEAVNQLTRQL